MITVDVADWYSNAATSTSSLVATVPWNSPPGVAPHDVSIYGQVADLSAGKTVATVTLPDSANLHLFTISPVG